MTKKAFTLIMDFWQVKQDDVLRDPDFQFVVGDRTSEVEIVPCNAWSCHGEDVKRLGYPLPTPAGYTEHLQVTLRYPEGFGWEQTQEDPRRTTSIIDLESRFEVGFGEGVMTVSN